MQTLRKKNSPCKFKNYPTRFLGEGVSFKAKLIGILEVSEARGDRMCQAALADLKMAIRAAGEHKQRIAVQVSIDGLRLRDEKTGDCLYHHPVHKISFIAQDMSDSRAFGYIFGSPDNGHRFFGIKTDKAASQVVIAMRDLFQVVFELKKKEIELAKQHIEQNAINVIKCHTSGIFVEPAPDTKGAAGAESSIHRIRTTSSEVEKPAERKNESQSGVIADLLDLQFELNSLQQGIHQMDKITPDNPVASNDDLFETDPFGDSFANMKLKETVQPILPPPPSSSKRGHLERQQTIPAPTSSARSSPATTAAVSKTPPPQPSIHWFDKETENLFNDGELDNLAKCGTNKKDQDENPLNTTPRSAQAKSPQIDVFTELDPLGTGLIKPYIDKKDFFQHLKNPPKKVLKDLVSTNASETFPTNFNITTEPMDSPKVQNDQPAKECPEEGNFANFDRFEENQASQSIQLPESPRKKETTSNMSHHQPLSVSLPPEDTSFTKSTAATAASGAGNIKSIQDLNKLLPKKCAQPARKKDFEVDLSSARRQSIEKSFPVDFNVPADSPASPLRSCSSDANSRLSTSSAELELVPEPPPRGAANILINPPPLPPKKQFGRTGIKPPPRPPHGEGHFHYDFLEREESSPSPTGLREKYKRDDQENKTQFDDNFSHMPSRSEITSAFEDSFNSVMPSPELSSLFTCTSTPTQSKKIKPSLINTLSLLSSSNLTELANSLDMTVQELTNLTLQQLTECLANLSEKEASRNDAEKISTTPTKTSEQSSTIRNQPTSKIVETSFVSNEANIGKTAVSFTQESKQDLTYDKYAVLRELFEMEQMKDEVRSEENNEDESAYSESKEPEELEAQEDEKTESETETIVCLSNLTVKLPANIEELIKEDYKLENIIEIVSDPAPSKDGYSEDEETEKEEKILEDPLESSSKQTYERTIELEPDDRTEDVIKDVIKSEITEKVRESDNVREKIQTFVENKADEFGGSSAGEVADIKPSTSTSSDRYAALREIIGESEQPARKNDDETSSQRTSPTTALQSSNTKSLAEVELLNLFSDNIPAPSSPKKVAEKKEDDMQTVEMDIFEEIKMLNTATTGVEKETKPSLEISGFEDMFCPFAETKQERIENKDDGNWAKFDATIFPTDRSSCEGIRSIGGTSPWSPDGKEVHKEATYKGSLNRHSGDSDNEWKDEEESEESNGRARGDGKFWCTSLHARFEGSSYEERSVYDLEAPVSGDRQKSLRERGGRKSRSGVPWSKSTHRSCDPSPWHEEGQWEEEPRRYPHRGKIPYKEEDETQYESHWKCRSKSQRWPWTHEPPPHGIYYDDERKRKMMLWNEDDRFGSQESMGYDDDDRWSRRKYERRRWEEDSRFWGRRPPPDAEYPMRESSYYYYREGRERPHDYVPPSSGWEEEYGTERSTDESPRYNLPPGRKRHWPKRPNSANDGRNSDLPYHEPRSKFGSRSECSDNDADPYLRPSQRSRSRDSYWGSDQEYDSWVDRPYWSEGPDSKSETLYRKRIPRHKTRPQPQQAKTQSPFEDDFAHQSVERVESPSNVASVNIETLSTLEPRIRGDLVEQKRDPLSVSPSSTGRCVKEHHPRREGSMRDYSKRSSYFDDELTPTASASSDTSDRQRHSSELKATPEELPCDGKEHQHRSIDSFPSEDGGRDSFYNGDLRFDDDAFAFKSELEDNVPDHRTTMKNARQMKYTGGNNNNNNKTGRGDQYIRKSESVNIFARENDPFDDDDFFN